MWYSVWSTALGKEFGQLHWEKCLVNCMRKSVWSTAWGKVFGQRHEEKEFSQLYGETCI